jgi:hypothetical protein
MRNVVRLVTFIIVLALFGLALGVSTARRGSRLRQRVVPRSGQLQRENIRNPAASPSL